MQSHISIGQMSKLGTIMSVWAHPDDESYMSAGLMKAAVDNGQRVIVVTATKGEGGTAYAKGFDVENLGEIRASELDDALAILGVTEHVWLGYKDGECKKADVQAACAKLAELIDTYKPDTILTFGPDGWTGHDDHCSVSKWATQAAKAAKHKPALYYAVITEGSYAAIREIDKVFNIFFNTTEPPIRAVEHCDICMQLAEPLVEAKFKALSAMPSQTRGMFKHFDKETISKMLCCEAFVKIS